MAGAIKLTVENFIATVVMDRPPVNAQNHAFREEMIGVFDSFQRRARRCSHDHRCAGIARYDAGGKK